MAAKKCGDAVGAMRRYERLSAEQERKVTKFIEIIKTKYDPLPTQLRTLEKFAEENHLGRKDGIDGVNAAESGDVDTFHSPIRYYCYSFLVSREWDMQKALEMMQLSVEYRRKYSLDTRPELPSCLSVCGWDQDEVRLVIGQVQVRERSQRLDRIARSIAPYFTLGLHYWDKYGQPVLYLNIGSIDEAKLLRKLKDLQEGSETVDDVIWVLVQHMMGVLEKLFLYQDLQSDMGTLLLPRRGNALIRSSTIVMDLKGLSYKMLWKPALDLFMHALQTLFQYYPQCVHQILMINAPSMVMFAYKIVRGVLPKAVQKKVHFANITETPALMKEFIDVEYLPEYLGGHCHCEGGCIPTSASELDTATTTTKNDIHSLGVNSDEKEGEAESEMDVVATEDIVLKAGQELRRSFRMKANETVIWEFAAAGGRDVTFAIFFIPGREQVTHLDEISSKQRVSCENEVEERHMVSRRTPSSGSAEFTATEDGRLVLVWDNKKSWFTSKHLQMKVFKQMAPDFTG